MPIELHAFDTPNGRKVTVALEEMVTWLGIFGPIMTWKRHSAGTRNFPPSGRCVKP